MKEMRRLSILHVRLDHAYVVRDVSVCRKNVQQSIEVIVKEKATEGQRPRRHLTDPGCRCFVRKETRSAIVIETHALVGEVANQQALPPGAVKISCTGAIPARAVPASLNATPAA